MDNFNYYSPTEFVFGKDRESECGIYAKKYHGNKVLVLYGGGSAKRSGLIDKVEKSLAFEGIEYLTLGGVRPNPHDGFVYEGIDFCRKNEIDFILAVGGGSVIDTAKAIAVGIPYDGDFWDFFEGRPVEEATPIGVILTIAAAGSEGSSDSVITKEEGMLKRGTGGSAMRPKFAILDPELTQTLPEYQTAAGIADIMSHVFERYFTNTKEVEISDRLCEAVLLTIVKEGPRVIQNPDNYEARANIMWAGTIANSNILGMGREWNWDSHEIEQEVTALCDSAHGATLAVIMPAWMEYVYKHDIMRFAQVAVRVWGCQMNFEDPQVTALEGIKCFRRFLNSIGMPSSLKELGATKADIPKLVEKYGKGNSTFVHLASEDVAAIYKIAAEGAHS